MNGLLYTIYQDAKRRGTYLELWTDPEEDRCFSIYQIGWVKIKKEISVNKRRQLEYVYVSIDSVSGIIFYHFVANSVRKFFSIDQ